MAQCLKLVRIGVQFDLGSYYPFHRTNVLCYIQFVNSMLLVITPKSPRLRESGLLDECTLQILRCAQDDKTPGCHPERSEGSMVRIRSADLTHVALPTSGESPDCT